MNNLFTSHPVLGEAVRRECAGWAEPRLEAFGATLATEEIIRWGFEANENPPVLHGNDVEFHPAWHNLLRLSLANGLHNLPWVEPRAGAHVARAALMFLASQNEQGHTCPISMTCSSVPALRKEPQLAIKWEARIRSGALIGMTMTERQGGSDLRTNLTRAEPVDGGYRITGEKWFCSAPMSDAFLTLAQAPGGLTCFLLPRGEGFHIKRLKPKLGNRSNASSEVEFTGAFATRIGEEGRGIPAIIGMVQHTRLDCVIGSAALIRQALAQAIQHCRQRMAFGKLLIDQPLMRNVLADLALESEAATVLAMRLARAFENEHSLARLATAAAKYWVCKRAPAVVAEALECFGGNGYIDDCVMPRLYREAPLNSIWEGSGNVICLDIRRAMQKDPESVDSFIGEIRLAQGVNRHFDAFASTLLQSEGRRLAENLALALEASLLIRFSPAFMADPFCATRLAGEGGRTFGTLPPQTDFDNILARAYHE